MRLNPTLLASVLLAGFLAAPARATTFEEFGRMGNDDMAGFIATEVQASADYLKAKGRPDEANKVIALFHEPGPKGGVAQLAGNMKTMFASNRKNDSLARGFDAPPAQVEDAVALTLRGYGIMVPPKVLMKAGDDFRPSGPPRSHGG